jgi:hypothetical protein
MRQGDATTGGEKSTAVILQVAVGIYVRLVEWSSNFVKKVALGRNLPSFDFTCFAVHFREMAR